MNTNELTQQVLAAVKGNDQAVKQLSVALLSHDENQIRQTFQNIAGINLAAEDMDTIIKEFGTEEQIAACT